MLLSHWEITIIWNWFVKHKWFVKRKKGIFAEVLLSILTDPRLHDSGFRCTSWFRENNVTCLKWLLKLDVNFTKVLEGERSENWIHCVTLLCPGLLCYSFSHCCSFLGKSFQNGFWYLSKVCMWTKWPIRPALIIDLNSMKRPGVSLHPTRWDASPSQGYL